MHALDPDANGEVLWQTRIGRGGTMGGIQWGSATDGTNIYVALSDIGRIMLTYSTSTDADPKQGGGMFALRLVRRRARLVHTSTRMRDATALQPRSVSCRVGAARRRVLGLR